MHVRLVQVHGFVALSTAGPFGGDTVCSFVPVKILMSFVTLHGGKLGDIFSFLTRHTE